MPAYLLVTSGPDTFIPACISRYRARRLKALGHMGRLMAPQFVKPWVKSSKNERAANQLLAASSMFGFCLSIPKSNSPNRYP
jgi:hypothetical protein